MTAVVRERTIIDVDELESIVMDRLGMPHGEEPFETFMDRVSDVVFGYSGPLALLAGDRVVEPAWWLRRVVLTHRLSEMEHDNDRMLIGVDLAGLQPPDIVRSDRGEDVLLTHDPRWGAVWEGPSGWLRRFDAESLLAVRVNGETLSIETLPDLPSTDGDLVGRVRAAYETEVEEAQLPVPASELVLGMLVSDPSLFEVPRPPLSELAISAGLEIRDDLAAHDASLWVSELRLERAARLGDRLSHAHEVKAAARVLDAFDEPVASAAEDREGVRQVLEDLRDPAVLDVVLDEMLGYDNDAEDLQATEAFAERLSGAARRPYEECVASFLRAVVAERRGTRSRPSGTSEKPFEPTASGGPRSIGSRGTSPTAATPRVRFGSSKGSASRRIPTSARSSPSPARQATHPGGTNRAGAARAGSTRRATSARPTPHLFPIGSDGCAGRQSLFWSDGVAAPRSTWCGRRSRSRETTKRPSPGASEQPIVIDVVLHEMGWFAAFLEERGELLPADEALLGSAWTTVDRTVYEVVTATDPGVVMSVRDLRTAERIEVRERTLSRRARPGMLVCARAVPDGESHQFVGGVVAVAPGTEADVLDLCDRGDPFEILAYVGSLGAPPTLMTRENEPLVSCAAELEVPDPALARASLDRTYESDDDADTWIELFTLDDGDRILRATLRLEGSRLEVETTSAVRMDRILRTLRRGIPGIRVISDQRAPFDPRVRRSVLAPERKPPPFDEPMIAEALERRRATQERRWCDQPVPALEGHTPREAAADPTRREALERLLTSFEQRVSDASESVIMMRPARLRALLGLADDGADP